MGEQIHNYHSEDISQDKGQKPERLALSGEDATVQDSSDLQQKRLSLMPVDVYTKPLEQRVSKVPVRPSPLLKAFGDLYIAKELLLTKIEKLQAENQELRGYVENRRKQARESAAKYRETNREEYNARQAKLMRERYAKQKQKAKSSSD